MSSRPAETDSSPDGVTEPRSMLDGGEVTPEEALAIQLWYTYAAERGDFLTTEAWLKGTSLVYLAAQKWLYLAQLEKDAWLAVAAKATELVRP